MATVVSDIVKEPTGEQLSSLSYISTDVEQ